MTWTRTISGYRRVETRRRDTLETVALRELGDAARWVGLADLNGLQPPYLTDDPAEAGPQVLLTGGLLMVPAAAPQPTGVMDRESVFGRDVALDRGQLAAAAGGDLVAVEGVANLRQALHHRLDTEPGELTYHPAYGCPIRQLIGRGASPALNRLAAAFVDRALRADPRIDRTEDTTAELAGDQLRVAGTAVAIGGKQVPIGIGKG
jgi:phage baseplate assembly protein W